MEVEEVIVNFPVQVPFRIGIGNEMVLRVLAGKANGGVVNATVSELAQVLGTSGPERVKCSAMVCVELEQELTVAVTSIVPPSGTLEGEMLNDT